MIYELLQIEMRRMRVGDVFDDEYLQDHSDAVILDKAQGVCQNPLQLYDVEKDDYENYMEITADHHYVVKSEFWAGEVVQTTYEAYYSDEEDYPIFAFKDAGHELMKAIENIPDKKRSFTFLAIMKIEGGYNYFGDWHDDISLVTHCVQS